MNREGPGTWKGLDRPLAEIIPWGWETAVILGILALALATRFWDLGGQALHHDESIHALWSWELASGRGYNHHPTYHGPLLYHVTALIDFLVGASDYTTRVSSAAFGMALVALPLLLRRWLGRWGTLATMLLMVLSPSILYYSRFLRMDIFAAVWTLLLVVAIFRYLEDQRERDLYLSVLAMVLLFSTKEIAFISVGIFGLFLCILFAIRWLVEGCRRLRGDPVLDLIVVLGTLSLPLLSPAAMHLVGVDPVDFSPAGILSSAPILLAFVGTSAFIGLWWDRRRWPMAALVFYAVFIPLFTTFFTNGKGLATGMIGSLGYWLGQQGVQRGNQPWFYYLLLLPLYEFLPLLLSLASGAFSIGRWIKSGKVHLRSSPFLSFLWFWFVGALALYNWAGEKMPWLVIHLAVPLTLIGGRFVGRALERVAWRRLWDRGAIYLVLAFLGALFAFFGWLGARPFQDSSIQGVGETLRWFVAIGALAGFIGVVVWRWRGLGPRGSMQVLSIAVLVILALLTVRYAWLLAFTHRDVAREILIYTQTSPDVPLVMEEIEALSARLARGKQIRIAYDNETSWPFEWYLREYPNRRFMGGDPRGPFEAPIVMVGLANEHLARPYLTTYDRQQYRLRWWFPEDYRSLTPETILSNLGDPTLRKRFVDFLVYRYLPDPLGSTDFAVYTRRNLSSQVWQYGPVEVGVSSGYEERHIEREADLIWGNQGEGEGQFLRPRGIAVDGEGNVYVVDTGNNRVQKFDSEGEFMVSWGGLGSGPGEFQEPWGIGVGGDGTVYVADTWNHRVQAFDSEGRYLGEWGVFGQGEGDGIELYGPRDIEVDGRGDVYVTDTGNKRVQKVSGEGDVLGIWGQGGVGPGEFEEPIGIGIGERGEVYVADVWNRRVQKFGEGFVYEGEWKVEGWESQTVDNKAYLAVGGGRVYVTDPEWNRVIVFSGGGEVEAVWGSYGGDAGSLYMPTGVDVGMDGRVYVVDSFNHRVVSYAPLGEGEGASLE